MLVTLYQHGVDGNLWNVIKDMYTDIKSQVKLQGQLSCEFSEHQGIRQGGLTSTDLFKVRANEMIQRAGTHPLAYKIGIVSVGAPTTADDTALISASKTGAQVLVGIAEMDSNMHRYSFSKQKTKLMVINGKPGLADPAVKLNGVDLGVTSHERHLGIERTASTIAKATVEKRIKEARRAMYRLAGAGLYGLNGVGPMVSLHMFNVYILPILTYGLEALILKDDDYKILEQFYRATLRRLQHLPENTATPILYLLLGCIPLEGQLHIKLLTFFVGILRRPGSIEHEIIKRQLAIKDLTSHSWVVPIRTLLSKYGLPSAYHLLKATPGKNLWKSQVKTAVSTYWMEDLKVRASSMKSLNLINIDSLNADQVADVWKHSSDPLDAHMATVKVKLLVQRYPLGYSYCAGNRKSSSCILCGVGEENVSHFLLTCSALAKTRSKHLLKLKMLLIKRQIAVPHDEICTLVLTPSLYVGIKLVPMFEQASRRMIYRLHCARSLILNKN